MVTFDNPYHLEESLLNNRIEIYRLLDEGLLFLITMPQGEDQGDFAILEVDSNLLAKFLFSRLETLFPWLQRV